MAVNQPSRHAAYDTGSDPDMVHAFNQGMESDSQQQAQDAPSSRGAGRSGQFTFSAAGTYVAPVISRHKGGEALGKIHEMLKAEFLERNPDHELEFIPVNWKDTAKLVFSALVVAVRHKAWLDRGVAYYTLIIEGSAPPLEPVSRFVANENITELRLTGETNNEALNTEVRNRLARVYPTIAQWSAGTSVVPSDFNPANEELAHRLAVCVSNACASELSRNQPGGWHDLNLADAVGNDVLTVRPTFDNDQIYNAVGHPVRADIEIRTTIPGRAVPGQQDAAVRTTTVSKVRGFMDLDWAPADQPNLQYAQFAIPQHLRAAASAAQYQKYLPRFVATHCEAEQVPTLGGQLLSIVSAACLAQNMLWAESFRPQQKRGGGELSWRNIGAVNIEANFENNPTGRGVPLDSTLDSFTRQNGQTGDEFHTLIASTIRQQLAVSIDIPECGPETWLSEVILLAGDGDPGHRRTANPMLINAANDLTDGLFKNHYEALYRQRIERTRQPYQEPEDRRLVNDDFNRIHLGYFVHTNGEKLDLRFIDYLALLSILGVNNHEIVLQWSDSFSNVHLPLELRLARRQKIIEEVVGERNVTYTGFARRNTLDNDYFTAILMAIAERQVRMTVDPSVAGQPSYRRSVNPFVAEAALDPRADLGLFTSSYPGPSQPFGNRAGFNRFMR